MKKIALTCLVVAASACTEVAPSAVNEPGIDDALLRTFRKAVPKKANLSAALPTSVGGAGAAVGDAALYPQMAVPHVTGVNQLIGNILDTVDAVVATPPTLFNSETNEFLWGPFDNTDSPLDGDKALVFIKDNGEGAEFRYEFAFARLMSDDTATAVPVIYGAVNPDPEVEDNGSGVLLLDFEASRAFVEENGGVTLAEGRGRFATGFARGPDETDPANTVTLVLGSFRGFSGNEDDAPTDVDHLWGNVQGADGNKIDFVDLAIDGDVIKDTAANETLDLQLVVFNGGLGRGEALLTGGDAGTNIGSGIECWNAAVEQQFYEVTLTDENGTSNVLETAGDAATGCPAPFDVSLDTLGLPTLDDVDPAILGALQDAAENGIGG